MATFLQESISVSKALKLPLKFDDAFLLGYISGLLKTNYENEEETLR